MSGPTTRAAGSADPGGAPRRRLPADDRRELLLDAAASILRLRGADALSNANVAEEAGVAKSLVHYHFRTRESLLTALYDRESSILERAYAEATGGTDSFLETVRAVAEIWISQATRHQLLDLIEQLDASHLGIAERRARRNIGALQFAYGLLQHHFEVDHDTTVIAASVLSTSMMGLVPANALTALDMDSVIDRYLDMVDGAIARLGLRPRAENDTQA